MDAPLAARIDALLPANAMHALRFPDLPRLRRRDRGARSRYRPCPPGGADGVAALAMLLDVPSKPLDPKYGREEPPRVAFIDEAICIAARNASRPAPSMRSSVPRSACTRSLPTNARVASSVCRPARSIASRSCGCDGAAAAQRGDRSRLHMRASATLCATRVSCAIAQRARAGARARRTRRPRPRHSRRLAATRCSKRSRAARRGSRRARTVPRE